MSTWTSETIRRAALGAACLPLAACGGGGFGLDAFGRTEPAPPQIAVTTDQVIVAGPDGYCVDPTATQDRGDTGFVLLGNCAAISNSRRAAQPSTPAVLTAAISAPSETGSLTQNMAELDSFFRTEEGLSLVSRSGDPATVTILDTATEGDAFFLHATDTSESQIAGVQSTYWRAYMDIGARIATLSVLQLEGRELSSDGSRNTLRAFAQAVRAANTVSPETPVVATATAAPAPGYAVAPVLARPETSPPATTPLGNVGFLRRLFN